jgi:hypothetical protein
MFQAVHPWVSSEGVRAGSRWAVELAKVLDGSNFGLLCVTRENMAAPWLLFEAGALSKSLDYGKVIPYLIDLTPADLTGPLSQFQAVTANREGTWKLVQAISASDPADRRSDHFLSSVFDLTWPRLQPDLEQLTGAETPERNAGQSDSPRQANQPGVPKTKTTEAVFLASCPHWARVFFKEVFQEAANRGLIINWGTKGFSVGAHRPSGQRVPVLYGYPPGSLRQPSPSLEVYLKYLGSTDNREGLRASMATIAEFRQSQHTFLLSLTESDLPAARAALRYIWPVYEQIRKTADDGNV